VPIISLIVTYPLYNSVVEMGHNELGLLSRGPLVCHKEFKMILWQNTYNHTILLFRHNPQCI